MHAFSLWHWASDPFIANGSLISSPGWNLIMSVPLTLQWIPKSVSKGKTFDVIEGCNYAYLAACNLKCKTVQRHTDGRTSVSDSFFHNLCNALNFWAICKRREQIMSPVSAQQAVAIEAAESSDDSIVCAGRPIHCFQCSSSESCNRFTFSVERVAWKVRRLVRSCAVTMRV